MEQSRWVDNDHPVWKKLDALYDQDEVSCVEALLPEATLSSLLLTAIEKKALALATAVRQKRLSERGVDALLVEYDLTSPEGIALMHLAEALLRIPDANTRDLLIREKLSQGQWAIRLGQSHSPLVNAATWALHTTQDLMQGTSFLKKWARKGSAPVIRQGVWQAIKKLAHHFVIGETITEAFANAQANEKKGYRYSYDMLGEAAYTEAEACRYYEAYAHAIVAISKQSERKGPVKGSGISVKLSALHPRFVMAKKERLHQELLPRLKALVLQAKEANIGLTIDAEESHTLLLSLELIEALLQEVPLDGWEGLGFAVQAYQKRAIAVIEWLSVLAERYQARFTLRLVKGAYWDTEIKLAQMAGLNAYPVFTRKAATDISYLVCAKKILEQKDRFYPQFATHNARTVATLLQWAEDRALDFEFQCLHGMGGALYDEVFSHYPQSNCRIYAPVGTRETLLAYLVRRVLENGANSSFVNQIAKKDYPLEKLIADPVSKWQAFSMKTHPQIPLPQDLFGDKRRNSEGLDLHRTSIFLPILQSVRQKAERPFYEAEGKKTGLARYAPANREHYLGSVTQASVEEIGALLEKADRAWQSWQTVSASQRVAYLQKLSDLLQEDRVTLYSLLLYEGGKILEDAVNEVREAIDFCRYYALEAATHFEAPQELPGPTGERNQLRLAGRGIILCISPWNFPLAIFMGQVAASLAAGNCVIAKPATQTPLIAIRVAALCHEAGFPKDVVQLLLASGENVQAHVLPDRRISGVVFTGSTHTAKQIHRALANRNGPIIPLIAETGGQNVMIVDSSALPEQVTQDVVASAFRSAGQRCSALRVLFLQEEVADKMIQMIQGAMDQLQIGDPADIATDVGPVIDENAQKQLEAYRLTRHSQSIASYEIMLPKGCEKGSFFAPCLFEIDSLDRLQQEIFGPVLHVVRFKREALSEVIEQIHRTEYGLTLGIQSRVQETIDFIISRVRVGNIYVNRNMIGAVVGVQPFGGEGLSGTGPKAGGPHYLTRLAVERTLSVNTAAAGGNIALMAFSSDKDLE